MQTKNINQQPECSPYARSYGRFISILGFMNKWLALPSKVKCAELVGKLMNPDRLLDEKIVANLTKFIGDSDQNVSKERQTLASFHAHAGAAGLDHLSYQRKSIRWLDQHVQISGLENLASDKAQESSGTLILTYHNHYKFLLPVAFGLLGHPVSAMAIDWKLSEIGLCQRTRSIYKNFFNDIESYFNGGQFIYLDGTKPINTFKKVNAALTNHQILISLNDVYHPISGSRNHEIQFFNQTLRCPTGIIEKATSAGAQILCAYIYWDRHHANYQLKIENVGKSGDTQEIVQSYVEILEEEIKRDPGFWEGWKLL